MCKGFIIYKRKVAIHPAVCIQEYMNEIGITNEELAEKLGVELELVNKLLNYEINIDKELANKLAKLIDTSVSFWINLQNEYNKLKREVENE